MACLPDSNPLITGLFDKGHAGEEQENDLDTLNIKDQFPIYLSVRVSSRQFQPAPWVTVPLFPQPFVLILSEPWVMRDAYRLTVM
jgi:hypothetical protein